MIDGGRQQTAAHALSELRAFHDRAQSSAAATVRNVRVKGRAATVSSKKEGHADTTMIQGTWKLPSAGKGEKSCNVNGQTIVVTWKL